MKNILKNILKNKKIMAAIVAVIAIAAVFVFVRKRKNESEETAAEAASQPKGSFGLPVASFPLTPYSQTGAYSAAKGSYGQQIANLQKICNNKFGENLTVDGKFGPKSEEAFAKHILFPYAFPYTEVSYNGLISKYREYLKT